MVRGFFDASAPPVLSFAPYTVHTYYRPGGTLGSRGLCLIIEDDRDIRDLLSLILAKIGFDVHAVGNGADGVAAAWEHHPALVTVDLNLPDMDGLEVAQHIRARSEAPMLFITARAELDDEIAGMASGAAAYLIKPFRPRQLTETVNRLCPVGPLTAHRLESRA
ncbi:response regulator transcription factor [Arthrobacter sp. NPDC056727]|uniref:response regulator transcription factor n=1 Tax=Arthrobacter sp. NPDC056727 TaxID=3345927 RepID=UPI00367325C3